MYMSAHARVHHAQSSRFNYVITVQVLIASVFQNRTFHHFSITVGFKLVAYTPSLDDW